MISKAEKQYSQLEIESMLEGPVREWFKSKYKEFTPPQKYAVMEISEGKNVLISSPTGSGKTLSAFISIVNELIRMGRNEQLEDRVYALYISPLKALNNDIRRNLEEPLSEIRAIYEAHGGKFPEIRVAVRTGDTPQSEKSKMLRKAPHILITTPETLAIILNAPKFSEKLENVKYVIVDEIHALAENKRGVHLSLSLERLAARCKRDFVRIGLSATVHPLEEVAKFLVGVGRDCLIVDVNYLKKTQIEVISPIDDLIYTPAEKANSQMYQLLDKIISEHRTTLIFTNTRSATERVVYHLGSKFGQKYIENVAAHHSSLSREHRLDVEEKLKRGELKVVVSSTSLELGIDIGSIDVVILLGSPKSVSRALQRIGRSGHKLHETSKGIILVLDRDDLIEDVVLAYGARNRRFDKVRIYRNALDVLAQHVLGMALERKWKKDEAFEVIRKSYCYSDLEKNDFEDVLKYLSGFYSMLEERYVYGKIWYEGEEFGKRGKSSRAIYYMNMGTIPDEPKILVFADKKYIGEIEESFAENLLLGDVFVLGGKTYEFMGSYANRVSVVPAESKRPTVPAWFSETLPLSYELALAIEKFRIVASGMKAEALMEKFQIDGKTAKAISGYLQEQARFSIIPDEKEFLVEEWKDDEGFPNYIFHSLCGRKANDAIARVFAFELGKKKKCNVA
ncbi:MAG: ATP-dependent helicase, partial [Candidatus Micrarchaeia archaeon]